MKERVETTTKVLSVFLLDKDDINEYPAHVTLRYPGVRILTDFLILWGRFVHPSKRKARAKGVASRCFKAEIIGKLGHDLRPLLKIFKESSQESPPYFECS